MAKGNKSGLGRGLGSLLGTSYEEEKKEQPSSKERILVEMDEISGYDPILEPSARVTPAIGMANNAPSTRRNAVPSRPAGSPVKPQQGDQAIEVIREVITDAQVVDEDPRNVNEVSIDLIIPNPNQPRTNFNKDDLDQLARSIESNGLLQPLLVRAVEDGKYQIIAGERRWQACKLANLDKVPVRVREADETKAIELALVENIQRSDLNPIEEAYGYKRLMERNKMTKTEIAVAMAKDRSTITNTLRLLDLPEEAQQLLYEEKMTAGHARAILSVPDDENKRKLTQKIVEEGISVREAENLARLYSGKISNKNSKRTPVPQSYKRVAKALKEALSTNVKVKSSGGKNRLEIEFKDEEDLERLFMQLLAKKEELQEQ